jgi:hypothetical protein
MFFIIYETTNVINGKKYRGAHTSRVAMDSYLGSGVALKRAIRKYGKSAFVRENIFFAFSEDDLYFAERQFFVTEDWIKQVTTYNQAVGGRARRINQVKHKPETTVYQYDLDGALVQVHSSYNEAAYSVPSVDFYKAYDLIFKCCDRDTPNQTAYGYFWSKVPLLDLPVRRKIHQWATDGTLVQTFLTTNDAALAVQGNVDRLLKVLRGSTRQHRYKGFGWSYEATPPHIDNKTSNKDQTVICIETQEVFESMRKAGIRYGKAVNSIRDSVNKGYVVRTTDGERTFTLRDACRTETVSSSSYAQ